MKKKGQLTIFVILGIVLIVVFAFAFFARSWIQQESQEQQAQNHINDALYDGALGQHVTSCLEKITENGIQDILLQGGFLYNTTEQKGPINFSARREGEHYLNFLYANNSLPVAYAVLPNTACNVTYAFRFPPAYPYPFTFLRNVPDKYCSYHSRANSGFYGLNNLSRLCARNGPNQYNPDPANPIRSTCNPSYFQISDEQSIQEQLSHYLENHLSSCTNFSAFTVRLGSDIIIIDQPNVEFIYGAHTVTPQAIYPFRVLIDGEYVSAQHAFQTTLNINLQGIYHCAFDLVRKEVKDVFFNKTDSFTTLSSCTDYVYQAYRSVGNASIGNAFDDVIRITDTNTLIGGTPLTFLFSIMNRRPALEYLHDPTLTPYAAIADLFFLENETIQLNPQGYDPDELALHYNYSMWRENYLEEFNWSCCSPFGPVDCTANLSSCMIRNDTSPYSWTHSPLFVQTGQNATHPATRQDVGLHVVNISILDREGLVDYQEVRILVFDLPLAVPNFSNAYTDVDNRYASIEDPYLLIANDSIKSTLLSEGNLSLYLWNDSREFDIITTNATQRIPLEAFSINDSDPIRNILPLPFADLGLHNLTLIVIQNSTYGLLTSNPVQKNVTVLHCLPHQDDAYPWPYHQLSWDGRAAQQDPFQADHACCFNGTDGGVFGTRKTIQETCFHFTEFGSPYGFTSLPDEADATITTIPNTDPFSNYALRNDIYSRTVTRQCSGDRGNTCTGVIQEHREQVFSCTEIVPGDAETCAGPNTTHTTAALEGVSCMYYGPGDSFERRFGLGKKNTPSHVPADGRCFQGARCANALTSSFNRYSDFAFDPNGALKCAAVCDGQGGCTQAQFSSCVCWNGQASAPYPGDECTAAPDCHTHKPGYAFSQQGVKKESGCGTSCKVISCTPYLFNPSAVTGLGVTNPCLTAFSGGGDAKCDDGFVADNTYPRRCIAGINGRETLGDQPAGTCEVRLGADARCDEHAPGSCFNTTHRCSSVDCSLIDVGNCS